MQKPVSRPLLVGATLFLAAIASTIAARADSAVSFFPVIG